MEAERECRILGCQTYMITNADNYRIFKMLHFETKEINYRSDLKGNGKKKKNFIHFSINRCEKFQCFRPPNVIPVCVRKEFFSVKTQKKTQINYRKTNEIDNDCKWLDGTTKFLTEFGLENSWCMDSFEGLKSGMLVNF